MRIIQAERGSVRQSTLEGKALVSNRSFMEKISEVEKDGYEEFKVVEDTVITQGHWWVYVIDDDQSSFLLISVQKTLQRLWSHGGGWN